MKAPNNLVEIILDSINPDGVRITTMKVKLPRMLLAELNTHRAFSRNSASSRAIPLSKMIERVQKDPFIPWHWYKNQSGMQGNLNEPLNSQEIAFAKQIWIKALNTTIESVKQLTEGGYDSNLNFQYPNIHKSIPNRLLEPFMWTEVLITSTEWNNFFELRCPRGVWYTYVKHSRELHGGTDFNTVKSDADFSRPMIRQIAYGEAEPHFQDIALQMKEAMELSDPKQLNWGEYHIPFGDRIDKNKEFWELFPKKEYGSSKFERELELKISVARCARVSYLTQDGEINYRKDLDLYDRLLKAGHMSPFEHQGKAHRGYLIKGNKYDLNTNDCPEYGEYISVKSRNFIGWIQYREVIENEKAI